MDKLPAADYQAMAAERGCEWLGPAVRNVMVKTGWRCTRSARSARVHTWQAPYRNLQQGHGCPDCHRGGRQRRVP